MDFRTKVPIKEGLPKIEHSSGVFLIGSCFVENIGDKLEWFRFKNLQNPTGIIFHPSPIRKFFQRISNNEDFKEQDVMEFNGGWQTLEAHSDMRRSSREECLQDLNAALSESRDFIKKASHVIISLGTAWGYIYEGRDTIAANCHKIPQNKFTRELSSVKEIMNDLEVIEHSISELNEKAKIIFTISPVRHLKDGFSENQHSKAQLISALHDFIDASKSSSYFPSYEIMMDELRDYRFYAEDMVHPNQVAVDYIWEKFQEVWIASEASEVMKKIDTIKKGLSHRPFNETSEAHQKFRRDLQQKIEKLEKEYPEIKF